MTEIFSLFRPTTFRVIVTSRINIIICASELFSFTVHLQIGICVLDAVWYLVLFVLPIAFQLLPVFLRPLSRTLL